MNKLLCFLLLFPVIAFSIPYAPGSSQMRFPNETFQEAYIRAKESITSHTRSLVAKDTPVGKKVPFSDIDYSSTVEVKSQQELLHLFYVIRDTRFLKTDAAPEFSRRISWLYPDDGCFARAAVAGMKLAEEDLVRPSKIFAFGNLEVQTPYSPNGAVSWWYHVAPIVTYNGGTYVLDPALDSSAPMPVERWFSIMGNSSELSGVVCNSYTYDPFDNCILATSTSDLRAIRDQKRYLEREWSRVGILGFDPYTILGINPPWVLDSPQYGI